MGHSSVLRARLKVLAYPHSASFTPPELFISCVHPTSPGLSSRNPAGSSLLVLCILCIKSLYSKFHLLETALFISVCLKIFLLILREFHTMYFDHYPCPSPSSPRLILHAYPPTFMPFYFKCPINTNSSCPKHPCFYSLPWTDISSTISCKSHLHSVLQKRLINHLCLEIQEKEHLTRRGGSQRQRLMAFRGWPAWEADAGSESVVQGHRSDAL